MFRDYYNYEVFEDGKIWSKVSNKFLKPHTTRNGYQRVGLMDNNGKQHMQYVHRVTWIAVKGEIQEGMQINHKDECKTNNHIDNLELVTPKENINFGTRNERMAKAKSKAMKGKIPAANPPKRVGAFKDVELVMAFPSIAEAGRQGFNKGNISQCCRNCYLREGNNKYKGYEWRYLDGEEN